MGETTVQIGGRPGVVSTGVRPRQCRFGLGRPHEPAHSMGKESTHVNLRHQRPRPR